MKYLFFVLLLSPSWLCAQPVKILGYISHRESDSVYLTFNTNKIAYYPEITGVRLSGDSTFNINLESIGNDEYVQAEFRHGNHLAELFLHKGDSLQITVDARHFDSSIHYSGRGSEIQNFVAKHALAIGAVNRFSVKARECINRDMGGFKGCIADEHRKEQLFLDKNGAGLPPSFRRYWDRFYQYYTWFFTMQYPQVYEMIKHHNYDSVPAANYVVMKDVPYSFNDSMLEMPPYLLYLNMVLDTKLKAQGFTYRSGDTATGRVFADSVRRLAMKILPDKSAQYYFAQDLYAKAKYQPIEKSREALRMFKDRWPKSEFLPTIEKQEAIGERLAPGMPAPDFQFTSSKGATIKLSDLRGNVVYIEFWANWCRQCVAEMIQGVKVRDQFKDKPVRYLYVSLGEDTTAEHKLIDHYHIEGIFTNVVGGWGAKEALDYGVQGMPAYFLIDKNGNFALQSAPSFIQADALKAEIDKLLN
jgi:peroxiredoxin